ncbi:hypothetical protein HMPREF9498_01577 [Enterococcus faecalis TX4248]|uniref:Uncharacterized protein n=1 Tax=Enterococcus faecalis TX4248 TaxID=749495 RepID=A0A125W6I3_ENTFL|nr:hypothetical protein HMPREF9498_01577 [Enterococcus faecalis TX4248]EFU06773.1 hypothetical protein HMPREF9513_00705 [Enterococcus faecalis TX0645]EPI25011.1 hypothetical protein D354_00619 [Enterococcus faecalis]KDE18583.1 hypothetical protein HMPREF2097_00385 [Enterococcus faecalis 918]
MLSAAVNPLVLEQGLPHRRGTTDSFPFPELKKAHVYNRLLRPSLA